jgi:hypothetical protein
MSYTLEIFTAKRNLPFFQVTTNPGNKEWANEILRITSELKTTLLDTQRFNIIKKSTCSTISRNKSTVCGKAFCKLLRILA